jgi:hypothetical protein
VFPRPYQIILTATGRFSGDRLSFGKQIADRVSARFPRPWQTDMPDADELHAAYRFIACSGVLMSRGR